MGLTIPQSLPSLIVMQLAAYMRQNLGVIKKTTLSNSVELNFRSKNVLPSVNKRLARSKKLGPEIIYILYLKTRTFCKITNFKRMVVMKKYII